MKKFFKFNNTSLLLDIGIIIYASFFLFTLTGKSDEPAGSAYKIFGLAAIFIMQTILPLYIAKIGDSYSSLSENKFTSLLISFMKMFFPVSIFFVFVMGFAAMKHLNIESSGATVTGIIFGSLFALFYGYYSGDTFYREQTSKGISTVLNYTVLYVSVLIFYVSIMGFILGAIPGTAAFAVLIISITSLTLLYKKLKKKIPRLEKNKAFQKYYPLADELIISIAIVFTLSFMLEIQSIDMLVNLRGDFAASAFALTLTGYLPLRILAEFEPPLTSFTIFTGIISTGYFLFKLAG